MRLSYLHNGNPCNRKMASAYWDNSFTLIHYICAPVLSLASWKKYKCVWVQAFIFNLAQHQMLRILKITKNTSFFASFLFFVSQVRSAEWYGGTHCGHFWCLGCGIGRTPVAICSGLRSRSHDLCSGGWHHTWGSDLVRRGRVGHWNLHSCWLFY